ncbi:hypothetical protein BDN67DRAFT_340584 [Paxillus ammoniavirescens]|nr:hypothetical protein BDN67DRAFT_340584 [Paxillus ammoniavirescens]
MGRYTGDASVWTDTEGNDIMFEPKFANGIARHPETFSCHVSPRSHIRMHLLNVFLRVIADGEHQSECTRSVECTCVDERCSTVIQVEVLG